MPSSKGIREDASIASLSSATEKQENKIYGNLQSALFHCRPSFSSIEVKQPAVKLTFFSLPEYFVIRVQMLIMS